MSARPRRLILTYVDALRTDMLLETVAAGRAPTLARLISRGTLIPDCVSSFPSVTPVASAEMVTGHGGDRHWIPGMNWYHRSEGRYVEYGSSLAASRRFGFVRSLHDLVYNMNLAHLSPTVETVFETLDDRGLDTAATPFLIFRGRSRHDVNLAGLTGKVADTGLLGFHYATWGPRQLFYGDLYASFQSGCDPTNVPGRRDPYAACCAAELIRRDQFDFMLLSLPDNDFFSHRYGPRATGDSIARVDLHLGEVVEAAGGIDTFLDRYAFILVADHAHSEVVASLDLIGELGHRWRVLQPADQQPETAELAVSPTSRAAQVYLLTVDPDRFRTLRDEVGRFLVTLAGVDLVAWAGDGPDDRRDGRPLTVAAGAGRFSFRPAAGDRSGTAGEGRAVTDRRGNRWLVEGEPVVLDATVDNGRIVTPRYPDALARLYSAALNPRAGDLLISLAPGYETLDWGGSSHVGGGSHGSLERVDSEGPLLTVGCGPDRPGSSRSADDPWALRDLPGLILEHLTGRN